MILSSWAIPTCSKILHEKVWGLQWDQNTPIKEVLSPMRYDAPKRGNPPIKEMQTEDKMFK